MILGLCLLISVGQLDNTMINCLLTNPTSIYMYGVTMKMSVDGLTFDKK